MEQNLLIDAHPLLLQWGRTAMLLGILGAGGHLIWSLLQALVTDKGPAMLAVIGRHTAAMLLFGVSAAALPHVPDLLEMLAGLIPPAT